MAIIRIICEECGKVVSPGECNHKFNFHNRNTGNHINMRKTWSGTTKIEFSETTMDKDIAERNNK